MNKLEINLFQIHGFNSSSENELDVSIRNKLNNSQKARTFTLNLPHHHPYQNRIPQIPTLWECYQSVAKSLDEYFKFTDDTSKRILQGSSFGAYLLMTYLASNQDKLNKIAGVILNKPLLNFPKMISKWDDAYSSMFSYALGEQQFSKVCSYESLKKPEISLIEEENSQIDLVNKPILVLTAENDEVVGTSQEIGNTLEKKLSKPKKTQFSFNNGHFGDEPKIIKQKTNISNEWIKEIK